MCGLHIWLRLLDYKKEKRDHRVWGRKKNLMPPEESLSFDFFYSLFFFFFLVCYLFSFILFFIRFSNIQVARIISMSFFFFLQALCTFIFVSEPSKNTACVIIHFQQCKCTGNICASCIVVSTNMNRVFTFNACTFMFRVCIAYLLNVLIISPGFFLLFFLILFFFLTVYAITISNIHFRHVTKERKKKILWNWRGNSHF